MGRPYRTIPIVLASAAAVLIAGGALSIGRWRVPLGALGQVSGHARQIRIELGEHDADPFKFRGHSGSVRIFSRRAPAGAVIEVGFLPAIFGAFVLLTAAAMLRTRPMPKPGACPHCLYPLRGLRSPLAACPECGGTLHPSRSGPGTGVPRDSTDTRTAPPGSSPAHAANLAQQSSARDG